MKKIIAVVIIWFESTIAFCQDLKSIDSTLKRIDGNVGKITNEILKKDPEPFQGQSMFEDRKGSSAIFLPGGGIIRINTADASLKLSAINRVSDRKLFYGLDISGKTNDGLMSLISSGNISPGARANLILGIQELFKSTNTLDGWLTLQLGYEGATFKLFNPNALFANQVNRQSFNALTSSLTYNMKFGGTKLAGLSIGYRKSTNYEDLNEIELTDRKEIVDATTGITRSYEQKVKVRSGDYSEFNQIPLNLDFFWVPANLPRIGFYHYWRTKVNEGNTKHGFGSGLYLLKKKNIFSSIAGIVLEFNDLSKLDDGFGKSFTLNFLVGYNFKL